MDAAAPGAVPRRGPSHPHESIMSSMSTLRTGIAGIVGSSAICFFAGGPCAAQDNAKSEPFEKFVETIPVCLVNVEMLPVPGGEGIEPFYLARTELSWDAFAFWALCEDIDRDESLTDPMRDTKKINQRAKKLRPSAPFADIYRGYGRQDQPALGLSRLAAERYCDWLSEETGRRYRLPTKTEWLHAFELNHGDPTVALPSAERDAIAWHENNSNFEPRALASAQPGALGHHDMLGNVCEWVSQTEDEQRLALGGHFLTSPEKLTGALESIEDASWNMNDPTMPKSVWWFVDAEWVGFRLVCERKVDPEEQVPRE